MQTSKEGAIDLEAFSLSESTISVTSNQMTEPLGIIPYLTEVEDQDNIFGLKYRVLRVLLLCTGICFRSYDDNEQSRVEKLARISFAIGYFLIIIYIVFYFTLFITSISEDLQKRGDILRTFVLIVWMVQILVSMILLFYWEVCGYNRVILKASLQYETKIHHLFRTDWFTRLFLFGFSTLIIARLTGFIMSLFSGVQNPVDRIILYEVLAAPFGSGFGVVFTSAIIIHLFINLFIILLYYGISMFAIRYRLLYLKQELEQLGERRQHKESTLGFYVEFRDLMRNTQYVNQHFQIYRLLSIAGCFSAMALLVILFTKGVHTKRWPDYFHLVLEIAMIVLIVMSLVYCPSAIKSTLSNVKYIILFNAQLWLPYDQKVYEVNKLCAEMADLIESNISVWGAQYARKPIIITLGAIGGMVYMVIKLVDFGVV